MTKRKMIAGLPAKEYHRQYRERNREKRLAYEAERREQQREQINARQRAYRQTPEYWFKDQRQAARQRGIEWELDFDTWLRIWQESGYFEERGVNGYVMSRPGDTGPYSEDNVRIVHHTENRKEAFENGRTYLAKLLG